MSSKVARYISYLLFRLLLPVVLLAGCALRYNLVSFLYLLFLLGLPLIPAPSALTVRGITGVYLILLIVLGGLATLAHAIFHIVLAAIPEPYGYSFSNCSSNEKIARLIAVERLDGVPFIHILRLVVLDVVVLAVAILVFIVCYKVFNPSRDTLSSEDVPSLQSVTRRRRASRLHNFLLFVGKFIDVLFLAACGIIVPSLASAAYFLSFLYIATWWSLYRGLGKKFSIFRICVLIWSGLHLLFLHLYQMQLFQEDWFPSRTSLWARILGLTAVIKTDCGKPWSVEFHEPSNWPLFVNPPLLLALYISVATETRYWRNSKREDVVDAETSSPKKKRRRNPKPSEREVLPQHDGQDEVKGGNSLVNAGENQSYETFSEEPARQRNKDDSPTMLDSDEEDGGSTRSKPKKTKPHVKRSPVVSLFVYIMKQSYVLSLIAMMAWSITYHSWLTFVLLLAACFIWMVPQSRKACLVCSPAVVLYGEVLLIIQFVYGMNLKELPEESSGIKLDEIGLKKFKYPCLQLALQILFTSMFWLTMRQFIRERKLSGSSDNSQVPMETLSSEGVSPGSWFKGWIRLREMSDGEDDVWDITQSPEYIPSLDEVDGYDGQTVKLIGVYVWNLLSKYWIFVCTGMMLLISIQEVVVYRIIYLILFLLFMLTFQMSYTLWRASMYVFWWVIIIYSMGILIILYTYQFQDFPSYWQNNTGLSDEILSDIGLEQFNTATLFVKLLTPTSFLILIILQVHYFHATFLRLSDIKHVKNEDKKDDQPATNTMTDTAGETTDSEPPIIKKGLRKKVKLYILTVWHKCSEVWAEVSTVLWRVLEVHFVKVVLFTIFMVCVSELSAIGGVFVIILGVFMPITRGWTVMLHVCRIWVSIAMVAKMIYQLSIIDKEYWNSNCTITNAGVNSSTTPAPVTNITNLTDLLPAETVINPFGNGTVNNAKWVGLDKEGVLSYYLRNYILILVILIFERVIFYRQARRRLYTSIADVPKGVIFSSTNRKNADKNLLSCAKYFANYFFYKFGLEICYIMMATVICVRVDAYSVLYSICLGILLLLSRQKNALVWPIFTIILTVLLPVQYILCLGFPPGACIEYPWKFTTETGKNLETWLYLPSYFDPPDVNKLIGDFFLLLFVCLQWQVFRTEAHAHSNTSHSYGGGSNGDILEEVEANMPIPVEDFTTIHESYLDVVKSGFFSYMYWVTLYIIFLAGTTRINLFSMGYIIGALCFMWYGQEFILKPLRKIRRSWNTFLCYTFFVIFLKASLQLLGCVYIDYLYDNQCWLIQLLGLTCLSPSKTYSPGVIEGSDGFDCKVEKDDSGLSWDVVCFTFLLLQLRIYNSHYFRHIIASAEAQNALAARGAELINHILVTRVQTQREEERQVLENIKKKMDILRHKRIQGSNKAFTEPDEHFQAIRSGDYYLFEDESEAHTEDPTSITIGVDSEEEDEDKADPLKLISTAIESGAKAAVEQGENEDEEGNETGSEVKEDKSDSKLEKILNILKLIKMLLESLVEWMIEKFKRVAYNHRKVAETLEEEMKAQKALIQRNKTVPVIKDTTVSLQLEDDGNEGPSGASGERVDFTDISIVDTEAPDLDDLDGNVQSKPSTKFENKKNKVYLLLEAAYYALVSRSELVCYFLMILNQILYCSLLSLPLPLMVFLWGMLSVPRPSKMFWITAITYTEAVVVIKYLFQFGFFSWNNNTDIETDPFWPPRIIGIEKKDGFVTADLILLLALFIHRSILKRYGLWKDADATLADVDRAEEIISAPTTPIQEEGARSFESSVRNNSKEGQVGSSTSQESDGDDESGPGLQMVLAPFKKFYSQLTDPKYNATTDVYATMFFCDFINFLILVFGYWAFGPEQTSGGDSVTEYITEDRIPVPFLIMLVTQFILIVIDRALYLRKNILGKFIFQILLVILIHVWLFFVLPYVTKRKFSENVPAQMFYFFKCLYFGLSAYQIRSSYPTRILGNFLTKKYNYINLFLFKGFLAIPFLLELRVLMDWIWTDSTLAIGSWLQMEDIYANIYVLKCWREAERNYPTPRSRKKGSLIKYGVGGLLLVLIIFIIWFPLVIFSFANTVYISNPPVVVTASIAIGGFQPLFKVQAQQQSIASLTTAQYNDLLTYFNEREMKSAVSNLNKYEPQDITIIKLNGKSTSVWGISPPSKQELIQFLNNTVAAKIEFEMTFTRKPTSSDASQSLTSHLMDVLDDVTRIKLIQLLKEPETSAPVEVKNLFSRFFRLSKKTTSVLNFIPKSNVSMHLSVTNVTEWWNVNETLSTGVPCPEPQDKKCGPSATELTLITLNDRAAPAGFSFISGYGIIGLYVTFILLIGRILRLSTTGLAERITYLELPYVDNILQLCLDVYLVREMHEFKLEEDLYAKLIFVYRSSETRIKWTRLPKDLIITDAKKND
nr:piezo-type mechanosensitive ion channel component 1 isoform X8 [Crassostrea gigas]